MACEHPKLMSVNCVIKCAVCGTEIGDTTSSVTAQSAAPPSPEGEGLKKPRGRKKKGGSEA